MRLPSLLILLSLTGMLSACKKEEPAKCLPVIAGTDLRFRIVDSSDADVLYRQQKTPVISQPCRTTPLVTNLYRYAVGNNDSATIISFGNLNTPAYADGVTCFRILFNWDGGDEDTVDWHYRIDEQDPGCVVQTIDYVAFNGIQARRISEGSRPHYILVK